MAAEPVNAGHVAFYEDRYARGYMQQWPKETKSRLVEIIQSLDLPPRGEALDFGCGTGVLTECIREALPNWRIFGADIGQAAVETARRRHRGITFFSLGDPAFAGKRFDFLFTHHVLEHVENAAEAWRQMASLSKARSAMLHILPCGNPGSLEHRLAVLHRNGIERGRQNRFFFEEPGHLRRLSTGQVSALAAREGFKLAEAYYRNHSWGGLEYLTTYGPRFCLRLTAPTQAANVLSACKLVCWRAVLVSLSTVRLLPARAVHAYLRGQTRAPGRCLPLLLALPLYPVSALTDAALRLLAAVEWRRRRSEPSGGEMCVFYTR